MFKKIVVAGLCFTSTTNAFGNNKSENSNVADALLDQFGIVEQEICNYYLSLVDIKEKSAIEIADYALFQKLLSKLSDSPVQYCQDKVLLSTVRWDDEPNEPIEK